MSNRRLLFTVTLLTVSTLALGTMSVKAQKILADTITLKIEGAKMVPVTFSHTNHSENINCAVCHHKDKKPNEPTKCGTCHHEEELKDSALPATDAFHKQCQNCHKESKIKGINAPTACNECHKK